MLIEFLNKLGINHDEGMVDDLPNSIDDEQLKPAVDTLLEKYDSELVAIYLTAFNASNAERWNNLDNLLAEDSRLQFGG